MLIYKVDDTAFDGHIPTLPHWAGPPPTIVHVQAILFASLVASLLSAFLAMLGKQWLNRYDSADMRGTAIERSKNRQRKLDGIVVWYFDNVMDSLSLMLQAALLLFGCALSRYLWGVNITIASVVVGVTSFGVLFYLFIVIAGTASDSCPYQTPSAHILRHHLLPFLRSIPSNISGYIDTSYYRRKSIEWRERGRLELSWWSRRNIDEFLLPLLRLLIAPLVDVCRLVLAMLLSPVAFGRSIYYKFVAYLRMRDLDQQTSMLNLRCVSWLLQASLDKGFHLTALKYLAVMPEHACFDPSLVIGCFNVFISCILVVDDTPAMVQGLEQLASLSASCFLRTFRSFLSTKPTSSALADLRRRYNRVFSPRWVDFRDFPFRYTMVVAHILVNRQCKPPRKWKWWYDHRPPAQELIQLAECVAEVAQVRYLRPPREKVPRWTLRFAFDSLSLDPPPPPSVVAHCLKIIALDLGCDVSNIRAQDERCV